VTPKNYVLKIMNVTAWLSFVASVWLAILWGDVSPWRFLFAAFFWLIVVLIVASWDYHLTSKGGKYD